MKIAIPAIAVSVFRIIGKSIMVWLSSYTNSLRSLLNECEIVVRRLRELRALTGATVIADMTVSEIHRMFVGAGSLNVLHVEAVTYFNRRCRQIDHAAMPQMYASGMMLREAATRGQ